MDIEKLDRLRNIALHRLESLQQAGISNVPRWHSDREILATMAIASIQSSSVIEKMVPPTEVSTSRQEVKMANPNDLAWHSSRPTSLFDTKDTAKTDATGLTLEVIQQHVRACTRCSVLAATRTQTVFGVGNPNARLCFLGEAPGADEDRTGEPFVGRAGRLLTKIIEACQLKREDVYILNMIKCRPPENRNPLPTELSNCRGFLEQQFDLIRPEFICCLGAVAAQNLLSTTMSIGKLRGRFHNYRGAKVICTYHPAFLLRSPSFKKETWEDLKFLMREMGVQL
jgi:uracil-DNA glycosylase